jgi:hypothetical protein
MPDARLALLHELERADEAVAAELAETTELSAEVDGLRAGALELDAFLGRLPEERALASEAVAEARRTLAEAEAGVRLALNEVARAEAVGDEDRLAEARRFDLRARDSLHMAKRRLESALERAAELDAHADAAERESASIAARAAEVAAALLARPRLSGEAVAAPGASPAGVAEWGTRARAALLVARSQLTSERDAVVRQANELGASVLGEELPPLGTAAVAKRVVRELQAR